MTDAERIHIVRQYYGLSMQMLADVCGVSKQYIGAIEKGKTEPSIKLKRKIVTEFQLPKDFFISDAEIQLVIRRVKDIGFGVDDASRIGVLLTYYDMSYIQFSEFVGVTHESLYYSYCIAKKASKRLQKKIIEKCNLPDDFFSCLIGKNLKITPPKY